ncbi:MAG: hypothetical protein J5883_01305, partial [Clostridiales bacterium]|nr:hypothetical protein [Clostridiales bacterium]
MNILSLLYNLFIEPLQLLFEFIFSVSYKSIKDPGICIIILSIVMNLLALPLYYKAEMIQAEAKREEEKLAPMIRHIKDYFSGDERIMILQTYYDQNNYHPLMVLKS